MSIESNDTMNDAVPPSHGAMPVVALIGRPNVGKSSLFNRLTGRKLALISDLPGTTRDVRDGIAVVAGLKFALMDTGGREEGDALTLTGRIRQAGEQACRDADVILWLIDGRIGVTPFDREVADWLRRSGKPVLLIVNKCEGAKLPIGYFEASSLALGGDAIPVSAQEGTGLGQVFSRLSEAFAQLNPGLYPPIEADKSRRARRSVRIDAKPSAGGGEVPPRIAVMGRPNVGKSTLINRILGKERLLTGPEAGLTRDAIAVELCWSGRPVRLVDTAGLRRRSRRDGALEALANGDALRALRFAELVILLVDGVEGLAHQDISLGGTILREGRAMVVAANKWDLVSDRVGALRAMRGRLDQCFAETSHVPVIPISGQTGLGLDQLFEHVGIQYTRWGIRIGTPELNRWLANTTARHPPPLAEGRRVRLRYMTQVKARPPSFCLWTSRPDKVEAGYLRFLANSLRDEFALGGAPVRIRLRMAKNPYAPAPGRNQPGGKARAAQSIT